MKLKSILLTVYPIAKTVTDDLWQNEIFFSGPVAWVLLRVHVNFPK